MSRAMTRRLNAIAAKAKPRTEKITNKIETTVNKLITLVDKLDEFLDSEKVDKWFWWCTESEEEQE